MMKRRQNFQNIAWFWDVYQRELLDLDPKYQRRSVWSQEFKDYFIDTILLEYPSPAIFLYEEIDPSGIAKYSVVDGKQRLTTLFEFIVDKFPVADRAERQNMRGKYFSQFENPDKLNFWQYSFSVEYIPTREEHIINNIFDRINRNVSNLTAQELRHARLDGIFIECAENLANVFGGELPTSYPRFNAKSKRQMKDVEFAAQLLLLLEVGPKDYSSEELDEAFSERDLSWDNRNEIESLFLKVVDVIRSILATKKAANLGRTRLHNQADFYSLFGAIGFLIKEGNLPPIENVISNFGQFMAIVEDESKRLKDKRASDYYGAAIGASTDTSKRIKRFDILKSVIAGL